MARLFYRQSPVTSHDGKEATGSSGCLREFWAPRLSGVPYTADGWSW
jgi:hypothetical protein